MSFVSFRLHWKKTLFLNYPLRFRVIFIQTLLVSIGSLHFMETSELTIVPTIDDQQNNYQNTWIIILRRDYSFVLKGNIDRCTTYFYSTFKSVIGKCKVYSLKFRLFNSSVKTAKVTNFKIKWRTIDNTYYVGSKTQARESQQRDCGDGDGGG